MAGKRKGTYKITNWSKYNESLVQRGSVTFWFSDKAEQLINESSLPVKFSQEFSSSKKYGAVRAISVLPENKADIENIMKLTEIKVKLL